jgi:hypothetical protein
MISSLENIKEEEVKQVVWEMEPYKAPGLDEFIAHFFCDPNISSRWISSEC